MLRRVGQKRRDVAIVFRPYPRKPPPRLLQELHREAPALRPDGRVVTQPEAVGGAALEGVDPGGITSEAAGSPGPLDAVVGQIEGVGQGVVDDLRIAGSSAGIRNRPHTRHEHHADFRPADVRPWHGALTVVTGGAGDVHALLVVTEDHLVLGDIQLPAVTRPARIDALGDQLSDSRLRLLQVVLPRAVFVDELDPITEVGQQAQHAARVPVRGAARAQVGHDVQDEGVAGGAEEPGGRDIAPQRVEAALEAAHVGRPVRLPA